MNKEWKLRTHLKSYPSALSAIVFPTGVSNMVLKQSKLVSKPMLLCIKKYQVLGPENYENAKFVTHIWWVEIINIMGLLI